MSPTARSCLASRMGSAGARIGGVAAITCVNVRSRASRGTHRVGPCTRRGGDERRRCRQEEHGPRAHHPCRPFPSKKWPLDQRGVPGINRLPARWTPRRALSECNHEWSDLTTRGCYLARGGSPPANGP
eukprot:scaffold2536_cov378-Prasinococcus_capsulatus_cf.AAC.5